MPSRKGSARKKTIDRLNHRQDLKQAEEARKESEENFRILFDENPLPTLLSEMPSGTIAFVNKRMAATVGMDPKDIIGKTGNDLGLLKNPGDEEKLTKLIACQGLVDNVEIEGVLPEGRPGTDLVSMRLVTIKGKKYCLTVIQDITERKRAEEALQRSGTLFSSAFRMSPAATILSMLQDGMCIDANEAYARLVGFSREELLGRTTTELNIWMSPDERESIVSGLARSGRLRNVPITLRKKDGSFCSTLASGEIITIEDKQCILSFFYDITERKQAEEALSRSQERYRLLYEYAPVGILLVNRSGQILEVNSATIQILGSPSAEATKGINILTFPLLIEAGISEAFRRCVETGQVVFGEYPYITKWEKSIHMQLRFVPIFDDRHQVNLVHTIIENITERKRMEEELQKAQKLESLGVLAGGIAHDFNNLLAGIFGNIDLARSVSKDPRVTGHLEATIATMGRARALTLQLLTFAKGGSPVQKTTPLVPFIQDSAHFALSGSNISCRFFLAGDLRPCNIDKNQIGQVIDNIVINAQQAMPNGGAIEITAENRAFGEKKHPPLAKGDYVKVSIKDFGIGIPKDLMPRIFDPFYTTKTKGHGLGLATCYSIINRHGGCIDVESEPGKGSAFHVYLPASKEAVDANGIAIIKHQGSGTIIVVDDEEILRITVRKMLESLGYTVVCKNDGKEAIDFFLSETKANRHFAAMIFDLTIPGGMGGKEAIAAIRELDKEIPVFVASGYADNSVMMHPDDYGFTASICKPFTIAELSEMLNKHLKN